MADEIKEHVVAGPLGSSPEMSTQEAEVNGVNKEAVSFGVPISPEVAEIAMPEIIADRTTHQNTTKPADPKAMPTDLEGLLLEMEKVSKEAEEAILRSQKQKATPGTLQPLQASKAPEDPFLDAILGVELDIPVTEPASLLSADNPFGADAFSAANLDDANFSTGQFSPATAMPASMSTAASAAMSLEIAAEVTPVAFILDMPSAPSAQPASGRMDFTTAPETVAQQVVPPSPIAPIPSVLDPKAMPPSVAVNTSMGQGATSAPAFSMPDQSRIAKLAKQKKAKSPRSSKRAPVPRIIGVDFTGNSLIVAESKGINTVVTLAMVDIPPNLNMLSQEGFLFLREQLMRACGTLQNVGLWIMAPDESAEARYVRVPLVSPSEMQNVAFWTIKREKDVDEGIYAFDYRKCPILMEGGVERQPVLASLVRKDFMERVSALCDYASLRLLGITPRAMAVENLFGSGWLETPDDQAAILFLEESCAHIYILREGHVALSRTVKTGLNSLVSGLFESYQREIADSLVAAEEGQAAQLPNFTMEDAFHFLAEGVFPTLSGLTPPTDDELVERIDSALSRLERQVERSLSNFNSTSGASPVSRIILCVPKACETLFSQYFSTYLNIESIPISMPARLAPGLVADLQKVGVALPVCLPAVGMSLSSEQYTPNSLVPLSQVETERKKRRGILSGMVVGWALIGMFIMAGVVVWWDTMALRGQNTVASQVLKEDSAVSPEQVLAAANELESMRSNLALLHAKRAMASFTAELSQLTPASVQLVTLRMISQSAPSRMGNDTGSATAILSGSLTGDILQREALLTDYLYRLQASPLVLSITVEKVLSGDKVTNFTATLKLV